MNLVDGIHVIYQLQGRRHNAVDWFNPNFDHFGTPEGFNASGSCWQKTGLHATYEEKEAMAALKLFGEQHLEYEWRVIKTSVEISNEEIAIVRARRKAEASPSTHSYPNSEHYEAIRRACAVAGVKPPSYVIEGSKEWRQKQGIISAGGGTRQTQQAQNLPSRKRYGSSSLPPRTKI